MAQRCQADTGVWGTARSRSAGGGAGQADPTPAALVGADGGGQAFGDAGQR